MGVRTSGWPTHGQPTPAPACRPAPTAPPRAANAQVGPLCGQAGVCPYAGLAPLTYNGQIPYVKRPEDSTEYNNMVRGGGGSP